MHWDFPEILLLGLGFGQKIRLENGIWTKFCWEMGFIPPFQDPFNTTTNKIVLEILIVPEEGWFGQPKYSMF